MSVSVKALFESVGLVPVGPVQWKTKIPTNKHGVYVLSSQMDPDYSGSQTIKLNVSEQYIKEWKSIATNLQTSDGSSGPKILVKEITRFLHLDEHILYIGQSSTGAEGLQKRLREFFTHKPGNKGPHTGGFWIKLLANYDKLFIYYAECEFPDECEFKMLVQYIQTHTGKVITELSNIGDFLPFANREVKINKTHLIKNATKSKSKE